MITNKKTRSNEGSTLLMALMTILVLSAVAASVTARMSSQHLTSYHSASWQEALNAAEAGGEMALNALNLSTSNPVGAWTGWTPSDAATFPKTYSGALLPHGGDGNNKMHVALRIDNSITDGSGKTWYRIRSAGTTELPGPNRLGLEKALTDVNGVKNHRSMLARMRFKSDATSGALHLPQVSRKIEVMVEQITSTTGSGPLTAALSISMSGSATSDSYDPRSTLKSTNGQFDVAKRQSNGHIAVNSSGNASNLRSVHVYGNASSNSGTIANTGNVHGSVYNNYSTTLPRVNTPPWTVFDGSTTVVKNPSKPVILTASASQASPATYKLSEITVSSQNKPLILAAPSPGQESYINIWVTGKLTTQGDGFIEMQPGVHVTIYVEGDVTVSGSALQNGSGKASYLSIFGVTNDSKDPKYTVSGDSDFVGVVYAPDFDFTLSGGGNFSGSMVCKTATISGSAGFHYDESLSGGSGGANGSFQIASWVEDIR